MGKRKNPADHRRRGFVGWRWVVATGAVMLAGGGTTLIVNSLPQTPSAAPLPPHVFGPGVVSTLGIPSASTPDVSVVPVPAPSPPTADGPRVLVPSLGIVAPWVSETISGGSLGIPLDVHEVGIWNAQARLGASAGNVVVAGHINYAGQGPGALAPCPRFTKSALPVATFNTNGPRHLVLITCGGPFDPRDGSYLDNVVVTAVPT